MGFILQIRIVYLPIVFNFGLSITLGNCSIQHHQNQSLSQPMPAAQKIVSYRAAYANAWRDIHTWKQQTSMIVYQVYGCNNLGTS